MRYRVLPYRQGSKSARALADALGGKVLKLEGSKYVSRMGDVVINWGNTDESRHDSFVPINPKVTIKVASNKLNFFRTMAGRGHSALIPPFWTNRQDIPADAYPVVCRTVLAGHSGEGIVIANSPDELVHAPLYVKYQKKKDEYRVHVGKKRVFVGQDDHDSSEGVVEGTVVIAVQRKARRNDTPDEAVNWQVRNHSNGFVFVRGGVAPDAGVLSAARTALISSGLDFGAVDVIWNDKEGKAYVLEINTAPGLEGQTIADYAQFFQGLASQ